MIIDNVIKSIVEVTKKDLKNRIGETAYSVCEIQEGYHDYLKIQVKGQKVGVSLHDFDWDRTPDYQLEMPEPLDDIPKEKLVENVMPMLRQQISDFVLDKANQPMFRYRVKAILEFQYKSGTQDWYEKTFFVEDETRKLELRERMNNYLTKVIYNLDRKVKDSRENSVFCSNLLDFNLMNFTPTKVIEVIEHCLNHTFKDIKNRKLSKDFEQKILFQLQDWVDNEFKPLYFDISDDFYREYSLKQDFKKENVNTEQLTLWVYTSFLNVKFKQFN